MKGQFTWDYIVSIVAFIALVSYLSLQIIGSTPAALNSIRAEFLRSEAYQLSEILINDPGEPTNWTIATARRLGLANESFNITNYVSIRKITFFNDMCTSNYQNVANRLGVDVSKYNFSIILLSSGSPLISNCRPPVIITRATNITMKRYVAIDNDNFAELILQTW